MGNYNPGASQFLGNEWVGIRDEDLTFSPAVNAVEQGHGFTLASTKQVGQARFYISDVPGASVTQQAWSASIYPRGYEDKSGPIQRLIIPCTSGGITGDAVIDGGGTVAQALFDPSDARSISFLADGVAELQLFFGVGQYVNGLLGKRILGVNLLHRITGIEFPDEDFLRCYITRSPNISNSSVYFGTMVGVISQGDSFTPPPPQIDRKAFGEINHHWTTAAPTTTSDRMPWISSQLERFEASAASRLRVYITPSSSTSIITLHYAALEVILCEEQRVGVGIKLFGEDSSFASASTPYVAETNIITIRDTSTQAISPILTSGDYTVVVSAPNSGDFVGDGNVYAAQLALPKLNALRELYAIDPHPGLQVNLPFPVTDTILGRTFTSETTHVLPQLSLHTTGGVALTEPHVYGKQAVAPIYSGGLATQGIINSAYGASVTNYPYVRFWARRYGNTTQPLVFKTQSGFPIISSQITVDEFDELPEIVDGWREVNLTFTGGFTPSFTADGTATTYEWSSSSEDKGSRWEVLGVTSIALSGIPGNLLLLQTVPTAQVLDSATYGGATGFFTWKTLTSGAPAADTTSDASVIFSQGMPAVSGFAINLSSQAVSGIGQNCSLTPECIPTDIMYHTTSWTSLSSAYGPSAAPITGFGYYEVQRMDTIDTDWATIAQISSVDTTSFLDYESRVGILSSYRIRACDAYGFCGDWADTVTATLISPGISGTDGTGVLIFTSNERQDGSINLAYTQTWESNPEESFTFPEAGAVTLREFYGYDFATAFRPLERGGERFETTLLIQAAAVSAPVLENVFGSLRDMAWDTVSQICVRNELGDRWFATVIVPDGRVKRNRRLQLARIQVIEVSDTPIAVEL